MNQGRLTLLPGKPVMDADCAQSQTLYYTPYTGNQVQAWDGQAFAPVKFAELALPLGAMRAGELRDVFFDGQALALGAPWAGNARVAPVAMVDGTWCDEQRRTYLGSVYAPEAGITRFQLKPAPVPNATCNMLGLWNACNRVRVRALCRDLTTSWSYANAGPRMVNNSNRWRISWIDGLAQSFVSASYQTSVAGVNGLPAAATVDAVLDAAYPLQLNAELNQAALNSPQLGMMLEGRGETYPQLGLHYYQAVEQSTPVPIMFYGNDFSALTVDLEM